MASTKTLFVAFLMLLSVTGTAQLSVTGYTNYAIAGFDVLVEDNAFAMDSAITMSAIDLLETNLLEIIQFNIDQEKMDSLRAVPIFMDWNTTTGAAQYHPSEAWLIANGYAPEKARCVEISNITNYFNWTNQNQPYMVMHELAHAYHHRVLNFNSLIITNAFNQAVAGNLYLDISYHSGGGNYYNVPTAYALNNEKEYFAEITEAYFGLNDFFPFDYEDLVGYDSTGFAAVVSVWGDINTSLTSEVFTSNISVYPNPSSGIMTIDLGEEPSGIRLNGIVDLYGKTITPPDTRDEGRYLTLNLSGETDGIYFIQFTLDDKVRTVKIIKR